MNTCMQCGKNDTTVSDCPSHLCGNCCVKKWQREQGLARTRSK